MPSAPGPTGPRPRGAGRVETWAERGGSGARAVRRGRAQERGSGGGREHRAAGAVAARSSSLHSLSWADTGDAGPPPAPKNASSTPIRLRRASCRLSWELCWSDRGAQRRRPQRREKEQAGRGLARPAGPQIETFTLGSQGLTRLVIHCLYSALSSACCLQVYLLSQLCRPAREHLWTPILQIKTSRAQRSVK